MDGLRWLLLIAGLLVIVGVYWYSRRERVKPEKTSAPRRIEPTLEVTSDDVSERDGEAGGEELEALEADTPTEPKSEETPQKIVTLRLVARDRDSFAGDELILGLRGIGMRHGKFGIFHRFAGSDENESIFSAASLVEPGSFDLARIKDQRIPGISLFLVLPGPIHAAEAFDMMIAAARALAQSLHADLLDESGSTLSIQRERYMREEVIQFEHSIKVA